eukprot:4370679-Alexandrium_andersonii.AAC.1
MGPGWSPDGRWPAAVSLDASEVPDDLEPDNVLGERDWSDHLPPSPSSVTPGALDAALGLSLIHI